MSHTKLSHLQRAPHSSRHLIYYFLIPTWAPQRTHVHLAQWSTKKWTLATLRCVGVGHLSERAQGQTIKKKTTPRGVPRYMRFLLSAPSLRLTLRKRVRHSRLFWVSPDFSPPYGTSSFRIRCPSIMAVMESGRFHWAEPSSSSACNSTKQPTDMAFLQIAANSEKMASVTSHRSTYTDGLSLLAEGFRNWLGAPNYAWTRQRVLRAVVTFWKG